MKKATTARVVPKEKVKHLDHMIPRDAWLKKKEAERISYAGNVPSRRVNWQRGDVYTCPELQHRSSGQAMKLMTLNSGQNK